MECAAVIAWHAYAYIAYGILSHYSEGTLREKFFTDIPSWVGPVRYIFIAVGFALFAALTARVSAAGSANLASLQTVLLIVMIALLALNGRRMLFNVIMCGALINLVARGRLQSMITFGNIGRGIAAILVLILFSNVYQAVRNNFLLHEAMKQPGTVQTEFSLAEALQDFTRTSETLERRVAIWRFHYYLMDRQFEDPADVMGGAIVQEGFISIVPRIFYPDKALTTEDFLVCSHYMGMCPHFTYEGVDYPQTLFSLLQADAGFLFFLLMPVFVIPIFWIVAAQGKSAPVHPVGTLSYLILFGLSTNFLMSVEQNIGDWFNLMRNIVMIVIALKVFQIIIGPVRVSRVRP
jgi:hypothetical protein